MTLKNHLYLLYLTTTFWTWFFLGGLWTNYYQDLSFTNAVLLGVLFPTSILVLTGKGLLKSIAKSNYFKAAIICATYFTVVLMTYDFIYLKLYLGKSSHYLIDYWYLTIFSPVAYLILLPIGYSLDKHTPSV
jgi:hypothetical protein